MAYPSNEAAGVVEVDRLKAEAFERTCGRDAIFCGLADADSADDTHAAAVGCSKSIEQVLSQTPNFTNLKGGAKKPCYIHPPFGCAIANAVVGCE